MVVPVSMKMTVPELQATVTKAVLDILGGQQESDDNDRRNLALLGKLRMIVETTETTRIKCAEEKYLTDKAECYFANITIGSKEDARKIMDRVLKLETALKVAIRIKHAIVVSTGSKNKQGFWDWTHYPYVKVTNNTPYDGSGGWVEYGDFCKHDTFARDTNLAPGDTWEASSRGWCLVKEIYAYIFLPGLPDGLACAPYKSSGTSYSEFFIIMKGEDACCIQSSHQSGVCAWINDWT